MGISTWYSFSGERPDNIFRFLNKFFKITKKVIFVIFTNPEPAKLYWFHNLHNTDRFVILLIDFIAKLLPIIV